MMHACWDPLRRSGFQYDIRATPEDLYLAVIACRRAEDDRRARDLEN